MKNAYGKRGDPSQKRREREVVKFIAAENARGMPASVIASDLNAKRTPSPGGGQWSRMAVVRILESMEKPVQAALDARRQLDEQRKLASERQAR
jgi:hypothetical protein